MSAAVAGLIGCAASGAAPAIDTRTSAKPSAYPEPPAEYKTYTRSAEYVAMPDGTKLAVDIYLPADGPQRKAFPVVFQYTPYQRSTIDPKTGKISEAGAARFFTSHGYAVVCADMRGTGASTGWVMDFMPEICDDGKQLVDWMAEQPWCDGNVGMSGGSYLGWSQTATASRKPKALKCIMPAVIPLEGYTGEVYPGGIFLQGFLKLWSGFMYHSHRNHYDAESGFRPTTPVVDEDGDGELTDEIPVDTNGNASFLDEKSPPTYRDGQSRRHVYFEATRGHEKNYDYAKWAATKPFIDSESPLGHTLYDLGPNGHVPGVIESGIPIYNVGGWFDGFARGSFELYCTLKKTNPSKLIMGPTYHSGSTTAYRDHLGLERGAVGKHLRLEHLRCFDRYLKGIKNDIDTEPAIRIFIMNGEGWRFENEWPLARRVPTPYYFDRDRSLSPARTKDGTDQRKADYSHDSSYGKRNGNRWLGIGGQTPDALPVRTEKDRQCLIYTSAPLENDTEVTGHPIVRFWVSSTANYGDFFVYLEDVGPSGEAVLVTEGQLRAGFAALVDNDEIIASGAHDIDVKPDLPWHGYEEHQYVDGVLAKGRIIELAIDYHPTAWVFRKGHRVRVSIACADYPTFRLHPRLCPNNEPDDPKNIVPTVTIHRGASHPSHIELPVIPAR